MLCCVIVYTLQWYRNILILFFFRLSPFIFCWLCEKVTLSPSPPSISSPSLPSFPLLPPFTLCHPSYLMGIAFVTHVHIVTNWPNAFQQLFGQKWSSSVPLFAQTLSFSPLTPAKPAESCGTLDGSNRGSASPPILASGVSPKFSASFCKDEGEKDISLDTENSQEVCKNRLKYQPFKCPHLRAFG